MQGKIVIVDQSNGEKYQVEIDSVPDCLDCARTTDNSAYSPAFLISPKIRSYFDRENKILKIRCAKCEKVLGEYKAELVSEAKVLIGDKK